MSRPRPAGRAAVSAPIRSPRPARRRPSPPRRRPLRAHARGGHLPAEHASAAPSRATALRPSRSSPWIPVVPSWIELSFWSRSRPRAGTRWCSRSRRGPGRPARRLEASLRGEALRDGREQVEQQLRALARGFVRRVRGHVREARDADDEREAALDDRLLPQQHAPHVGVLDDRHLRLRGSRSPSGRPCGRLRAYASPSWYATDAVATASPRRRCAPRSSSGTCTGRPGSPRRPASRGSRPPRRTQGQARQPPPADLVDRARDRDVVVDERAVLEALLRHAEQRDAPDPGRRAVDAGQHHVHDVRA